MTVATVLLSTVHVPVWVGEQTDLLGWALIGGLCPLMCSGEGGDETEHREGGTAWREAGGPGGEGR